MELFNTPATPPQEENPDNSFEKLSKEELITDRINSATDLRSLSKNLADLGEDIVAQDGYVYKLEDVLGIIGNLKDSNDENLQRVTRTHGLRDKVRELLMTESAGAHIIEDNKTEQELAQDEPDSEPRLDENLEDFEGFGNFDGSKTAEEIKEYEKANNVDQNILMQSWLAHTDIYKSLSEKVRRAMEVSKEEFDNAVSEKQKEEDIMNSMFQYLTKKTLKKYKEDLKYRGVASEEVLNQL